jgi:hypothetical protein
MAYLDDIADYIQTAGLGTIGEDLFTAKMPDSPDACACLTERSGIAPDAITTIERPGFRVLCRGEDSDAGISAAFAKAYAIKKLLHRAVGLTLGTTLYHRIDALGAPSYNAQDDRGRPIYELSFVATKEEE